MTTYSATITKGRGQMDEVLRTTSIRKARAFIAEATTPAYIVRFEKWNAPMPLVEWNEAHAEYIRSRGREPEVGMKAW